jgi:hypothetical protein
MCKNVINILNILKTCKNILKLMMQTILKGFVQKSSETRFSTAATAKHKSKTKTIGAIQYGKMTKLAKWAK